jgi:hypothetical protein
MQKLFFLILITPLTSFASEITKVIKYGDVDRVISIYREEPKAKYSRKELVYISYSLKERGFYRQDVKVNIRLIKEHYLKEHKKLLEKLKKQEALQASDYPAPLKILYLNLLIDYAHIIKGYSQTSELLDLDFKRFKRYEDYLRELNFREEKVTRIANEVTRHISSLADQVYHFQSSWSVQYVSWQTQASLSGNGLLEDLTITNRGFCLGGEAGLENKRYHFFVDGCLFLNGSGEISEASITSYNHTSIPAAGFKLGPGAAIIFANGLYRIGVKLPLIYSVQQLSSPADEDFRIKEDTPLSYTTSLYSRWQYESWFAQAEIGKYIWKDGVFWGLGLGRNF